MNQLIKFGFWLMNKEYPVAILGVIPVKSVRGCLPNGFYCYWSQYLKEMGDTEQEFGREDFNSESSYSSNFDEFEFMKNTEPYSTRNYSNPACVIFFQGLQGSGKSTLGQSVQAMLATSGKTVAIVEQDRFYGCTLSERKSVLNCIK